MPPDAAQLDGLDADSGRVLSRSAHRGSVEARPTCIRRRSLSSYHEPVSRAVLLANAYTRNPTSGYLGHRFQIYFDLLGAPNQVQTRSYADD